MFKTYREIPKTIKAVPKTIKAVQFRDDNKIGVLNSLTGQYTYGFEDNVPIIRVTTIHGEVAIIRIGDWIIKKPEIGCYYPVNSEIFHKLYIRKNRNQNENIFRWNLQ